MGCSDEEPAEETGLGGSAGIPDASVRDLPGDGLLPTPEFDTDSRQRQPIGPQDLVENIEEEIRGGRGTGSGPTPSDAGSDAGADAGAS